MERYFKKLEPSFSRERNSDEVKRNKTEIDVSDLPTDPGLRIPIMEYPPNVREVVRRAYLQKGPCQPQRHDFPSRPFGEKSRKFNVAWFIEYENWLEYSIAKDKVFCLCCYLFKPVFGGQAGGDSFVGEGFSNWKKGKERFNCHVGGSNSAHNQAWKKCQDLMNEKQHIELAIFKQSERSRSEYRIRLNASVDCVRFLLQQGLAFRGHNESEESTNQGNFLELLQFLANHNDEIKNVTFDNARKNLKLTSPDIQKDIVSAVAIETINVIINDIGDALFSILVDESRDISMKEQMAVVLRYVDKNGCVIERFIGIEHVSSTTSVSLKYAIDNLFSRHNLSMSRLRGQGYDGASNMQGEFNGLKALILKENPCAFYIHCFAHQLQLALVAVAKKHSQVASLFNLVTMVVNVVGASAKRCDILQEKQASAIFEALNNGEISTGRGLNQPISLKRYGDTRWGSHYGTLLNLIMLFSSVIDVLEIIVDDGSNSEQKFEARILLESMQSFDFVFGLHLMRAILGMTNELSKALQRKDQDIVNAMSLVRICKEQLQALRNDKWDSFLDQVSSFCEKHSIDVPDMNAMLITRGRPRRQTMEITNLHHFKVEFFYAVIDFQLQELNDRFTEATTELLLCIASLCPDESFSAFDKEKLKCLAKYYPEDFSALQLMALDNQLETYIDYVRSSEEFKELKGISSLAKKMVETKINHVFPLVYMLVVLALILPVATATVERVFSAMNIVKNRLRNRMRDEWMNNCLIAYIESDISSCVDNEVIMQCYQKMKPRREQL